MNKKRKCAEDFRVVAAPPGYSAIPWSDLETDRQDYEIFAAELMQKAVPVIAFRISARDLDDDDADDDDEDCWDYEVKPVIVTGMHATWEEEVLINPRGKLINTSFSTLADFVKDYNDFIRREELKEAQEGNKYLSEILKKKRPR
jgi:hypothetical protein